MVVWCHELHLLRKIIIWLWLPILTFVYQVGILFPQPSPPATIPIRVERGPYPVSSWRNKGPPLSPSQGPFQVIEHNVWWMYIINTYIYYSAPLSDLLVNLWLNKSKRFFSSSGARTHPSYLMIFWVSYSCTTSSFWIILF